VTTKIKSPERLPSFPQNVQIFRLTEYEEMPAIETP